MHGYEKSAAIDISGNLGHRPIGSLLAGLTRRWSAAFRSTVRYGCVSLVNVSGQDSS